MPLQDEAAVLRTAWFVVVSISTVSGSEHSAFCNLFSFFFSKQPVRTQGKIDFAGRGGDPGFQGSFCGLITLLIMECNSST